MALKNLINWAVNPDPTPSSCGTACGVSDKPIETPTACGAADKKEEAPAACGTACGAGDK